MAGLERNFDKFILALDIMLELKAYHPWRVLIDNFLWRFIDVPGFHVTFLPSLVTYVMSHHQYQILGNASINSQRTRKGMKDIYQPPVYSEKFYPAPLIAKRAKLLPGQSLYDFSYTATQLIEMLFDGVDLLELLNDEMAQNFPHHPEKIDFSGTLVLYHLADEYDPRMARAIFGSAGFKNWLANNTQEWDNTAQAFERFLTDVGLF